MSADSNRSILAFQAETAWGETPSPVNLKRMRITGEALIHEKMTTVSAEVRDDRQIADLVEVGQQASGTINFELSYASWKPLLIAALMASPTTVNINATLAINHTTQVITGAAGDFDDVEIGSLIKIAGAANAANNGIKAVVAKAVDGSTITLAAGSLTVTEASPTLTITGSHARNGVTRYSYLLERKIVRDDAEDFFQSYAGMMADKLDLNIASRTILTGSLSFLGRVGSAGSDTTLNDGGADYAAAEDGDVLNATSNVAQFAFDGTEAEEYLKSLSISLANNLRGKDAIGEIGNFAVGVGSCNVTGAIDAYFRSNNLLEKFRQHQDVSIRLQVEDADGNTMGIFMPRVKFSSGTPAIGGKDQDIMVNAQYQAIRDPDLGFTIAFDFIDA